jgi:hypothetical protein
MKHHVVYESRPRSVIITLYMKLYRIPKVVPPTSISLIFAKQCRKVISRTGKFFFFMIHSQSEWKVTTTSMASIAKLSTQHKQVDKVMEEYKYIYIILTQWGTSTLSSREFNRSDPWFTTIQWASISPLSIIK